MNRLIFLLLVLLLLITGCSRNSLDSIRSPLNPDDSIAIAKNPDINPESMLWGQWSFYFDTVNKTVEVLPERIGNFHFNITHYLPTPVVMINSFDPLTKIVDVDVTIHNSFSFSGYDVRGIIYTDDAGHRLMNPDDWTALFDIPGGLNENPFRAFAKTVAKREFARWEQHTEKFMIYLPNTPSPVRFAIEASWPGNCQEPYKIENFSHTPIHENIGSTCEIRVDVYDWQNNANSVTLSAQALTGVTSTPLNYVSGKTWKAFISNQTGLTEGSYEFLLTAMSSDSGSLALYDYATIMVLEGQAVTDWTLMIYLHESNLYEYAIQDMNEMEVVGSRNGDLNIIVLWDKEDSPYDVILRIEKDPGGYNYNIISPEVEEYGVVIPPQGLDMGDGETLEKFLRWTMGNYPAEHYGLVLWDHGDGPFGAVPETGFIRSCCNGLSVWEIRDACLTILDEHPEMDKFDFIGFDACLMGWIETAFCLRNVTKSTIGSEMTEPGDGWYYTDPLQFLLDNITTCDYKAIGEQIVISYIDSVTWDDCTLAASDSEVLINDVTPALNTLADELINALGSYRSTIESCWTQTGDWGDWCWEYEVKDLGYFCQIVANRTALPSSLRNAASDLKNKIELAMIEHGHSGSGSGCPNSETGWQIWFTDSYYGWWNDTRRVDYVSLEFDQTNWDDFLKVF